MSVGALRKLMTTGTVIITGASSILGEEMARQFADLGYDLGLCARRTERLEELAAEIRSGHPGCLVLVKQLDVNDHDAVFGVFDEFAAELGPIDRIVINADLGMGARLGTGRFEANRQTAMTNFVGGLAQTEAAMEIFRDQRHGHLVMISSMLALRGMPKARTTYAATKAGVTALAEGLLHEGVRAEGIDVSIIHPGRLRVAAGGMTRKARFMPDTQTGVRAMVQAIERRKEKAYVPAWPWGTLRLALQLAPMSLVRKLF